MLVTLWAVDPGRFTINIGFSNQGANEETKTVADLEEVLSMEVADGLTFGKSEIRAIQMTGHQIHGGVRLKTVALPERVAGAGLNVEHGHA